MSNKTLPIVIISISILFASCKKDKDQPTPDAYGKVKLEFFNMVGASNLNLNNQWYQNEHGDSFKVTKFNYYISNIQLSGPNSNYVEPESYHLLQSDDDASLDFDMPHVPAGSYTSITFTIGVDSLHNVSGAQTGALDPQNGMFWSWSTGYIMLKFEGISPRSTQTDGSVILHCGGFSGVNNVVKTITLSLPNPLDVSTGNTTHMHLAADVLELFKAPNIISFATTNVIHMPGSDAKKLSDNYARMFSILEVGHE